MYAQQIRQFGKMLENLSRWLDDGAAYAKAKSFDPSVLLASRLAPDQYALTRQVQAACDAAKSAAARLAGREPPRHPDEEVTFDEVQARIAKVIAYLKEFSDADFEGAATRAVPLPFLPGKGMNGEDYLRELALPNFYFHVTTAYSILRHNGVALGKTPFIGSLVLRDL